MELRRTPDIFEISDLKIWALSGAVSVLILFGLFTRQELVHLGPGGEVFLRLALGLVLVAIAIGIFQRIWRKSPDKAGEWWNVGNRLDDPSWEDVRLMTVGNFVDDPVTFQPQVRRLSTVASAMLSYIVVGCLTIEGLRFIAEGPILPKLLSKTVVDDHGIDLNLNGNLTAFLALVAAAISIYFTHRQLQAKVKADSRQDWINKLRAHIAKFIALADAIHEENEEIKLHEKKAELTTCRLEIELMLNPSEKDHRLLMFLGIKLAFFEVGELYFKIVEDVMNVRQAIAEHRKLSDSENESWDLLIGPIPDKNSKSREKEYSDLVGYQIRLAHVVLKREWERVKATR